MGWAGGSDIACVVIQQAKTHIKNKKARTKFYEAFYDVMTDHDWDTKGESERIDPLWDELLKDLHPDWYEEDET